MKKIIINIIIFIIGIALIGLVIILGILSANNNKYILWFGLASALIAPIGISLITTIFKIDEKNVLKKLLKVSEIDELIKKAETQEEKIKILEEERKQLSEIVKYETAKYAILERKKYLESEAERILKNLDDSEHEMNQIIMEENERRSSSEVIDNLYKRLEKHKNTKNNIINDDFIILSFFNIMPIPFSSSLGFLLWKLIKPLFIKNKY